MKKFTLALLLGLFTLGSSHNAYADDNGLIENASWLFYEQSLKSLAAVTATGVGAYFLADLCRQEAEELDTLVEKKALGKLKKTGYCTLAFLSKAANITGKTYAIAAIGSLPIRYLIPIFGEENVKELLKNIHVNLNLVLFNSSR